jgi:hypothetical protein
MTVRTQDMFRGRLMIPLQDPQGKVIGFTARLLEGDDDSGRPKVYQHAPNRRCTIRAVIFMACIWQKNRFVKQSL